MPCKDDTLELLVKAYNMIKEGAGRVDLGHPKNTAVTAYTVGDNLIRIDIKVNK